MTLSLFDAVLKLGSSWWPRVYGPARERPDYDPYPSPLRDVMLRASARGHDQDALVVMEAAFAASAPMVVMKHQHAGAIRSAKDKGRRTLSIADWSSGRPTVDMSLLHLSMAATKWVDGACRTLESDPRYFAAMARTSIGNAGTDLHVPWPTFVVRIPRGLIGDEGGTVYDTAIFAQFDELAVTDAQSDEPRISPVSFVAIYGDDDTTIHQVRLGTLGDHLFDDSSVALPRESDLAVEMSSSDDRILQLVKDATIGLLFTLQHTKNWRHGGQFDRAGRRERRESTKAEAEAIFRLAGFAVSYVWELANGYWPDHPTYDDARDPWWLMLTEIGPVQIGWRKRGRP